MTSNPSKQSRLISLCAMIGLFALLLVLNVPAALAGAFVLDWSQIGFVDGTSSLQTFPNVNGSGVEMTTEVRVLDAAFQDLGLYIPGATLPNEGMPKAQGTALAVRDISTTAYPGTDVGYVHTIITFSPGVTINELWTEPFFNWTDENVRKHLGLQAFDSSGNGVAPVAWTTYGGSDMIVDAHPANGEPWLHSSYPDSQTTYSGANGITYGDQVIWELHWYSWGYEPDGTLSHLLGSTYLGDFQFTPEDPTAITHVSFGAVEESRAFGVILLTVLLVGLTALVIVRQRLINPKKSAPGE